MEIEDKNVITNNEKTKKIAEKFSSTEELINKNKEIEDKITSTELINFYFQALENSNALLEKNEITEKNFEKILKIIEDFSEEVEKLTIVTEDHKKTNEDRKTIDAYKDSYENLNRFVKKIISKLNQVTIIPQNSTNKIIDNNNNNNSNNNTFLYFMGFVIITVISIIVYKIFL